jgi:hypothetical protein
MTDDIKLGPTGDFPQGKLNPLDRGGIQCAIGLDPTGQRVMIEFGTPVDWIGLDKKSALAFAASITKHAENIE